MNGNTYFSIGFGLANLFGTYLRLMIREGGGGGGGVAFKFVSSEFVIPNLILICSFIYLLLLFKTIV